ncbi:MAG: integrase family protein [Burkholderiales bacterium]|nr:integrase family protein [Burkholderiales bacterium]
MSVFKLTAARIAALPIPVLGQDFYRDSKQPGFGVRVSPGGTISFFAEGRVNGKTRRITIGPWPQLTVEEARRIAKVILSELIRGIDRKAEERNALVKTVTLAEAFKQFKETRKSLADRTKADYTYMFNRLIPDWMKLPWVSITREMVLKRHAEVGKVNGWATANHLMRALGSVFRSSMKYYRAPDGSMFVQECPTSILSDAHAWFPKNTKDSYIKPHQLKAWFDAVQLIANKVAADYLIFLVLTGLRRSEGASLRWDCVDLISRTLTIEITKNKRKHVIPISDYLLTMLTRLKENAINDFVFPGNGKTEHIVEIKKNVASVVKASQVSFTLHDLRRTFITIAESLDISAYAVKRLANHSMGGDVTATHYIVFDIERLRDPMEKINRYILRNAGILPTAEVVPLTAQASQVAA